MDLPASYYGNLDKRNPVIIGFVREINSFIAVMKKSASSPTQENNSGYVKGVKMLMEIWKKYKHRLPASLFQEHMLQVADALLQFKFHEIALWYGYSLHLQQYTSVDFLDIEDMDHFKSCYFPEGLDTDQDTLLMKIRALYGCALCTFEHIKGQDICTPDGLYKLLCVLDLIRLTMQVFQHYDSLCWQIYNGSVLIYNICHFLMTKNYSTQALEYLLWASFSIELSVPLMTSNTLPWLVTLHCAVCQCYYDNQAAVQGEIFARRALVKVNELANLEEQCRFPASKENRRAFKEASIKLVAMVFKRAVFEARTKTFRFKTKKKLSDIPNTPWPRNTTEQILSSLFEGGAAQFLGVLEALRGNSRSGETGGSEDLEGQEVVLELLAAGICLLSESELKNGRQSPGSLCAVTTSSSQIDLAIAGENKIYFEAALEFIKQLYYYKQSEAFAEYSREMLQLLSCLKGNSLQAEELELALLYYFNHVQKERQKSVMSVSDEFIELMKTLHKYVCDSNFVPNQDLALAVILFVWDKVAAVIDRAQRHHSESKKLEKGAWCLSVLLEVAFAFDLCTTRYFLMTGEMVLKYAMFLESAAKRAVQNNSPEVRFGEENLGKLNSFSLSKMSSTQLLQKLCEVLKRWSKAFSKSMSIMLPQDGSALFDSASMQKYATEASSSSFQEGDSEDICPNVEAKHTWSKDDFLLAVDLHLHLKVIYYRASLALLHCNADAEFEIFQQIKKNKISRAVFLMQKALMVYHMESESPNIKNQLEESGELIRKAGSEERKLYQSTLVTSQSALTTKGRGIKDEKDCPPPAPVLVFRSDHSLSFAPAPYSSKEQVCWYQLLGHTAEGTNLKVRLGDCSLTGRGSVIRADCDQCVLKVEGLNPDQKYVFAVAAYNSQGDLVGNSIGETTIPVLASPPIPLLTTWALLAQVAFQTKQYDVAKRACQNLWSHFTYADTRPNTMPYELVTPRLQVPMLHLMSLALRQSVFASIFIETEINIQRGSLQCNLFSDKGLFIWAQIARLEECERMLLAIDLVPWLIDHSNALQAVIVCYALMTPIIYHQIACNPVIQVLTKCLKVLEKNLPQLKLKWTGSTSVALMHRIACITYYLYKALHNLQESEKATVLMDCGVNLLQEIYDSQNKLFNNPNIKKSNPILKSEKKMCPQLRALLGKNKNKTNGIITFSEDHSTMYEALSSTPIRHAFQDVMKLKQKTLFIESSILLLQRALEEGEAALVIEWEQCFMELLRKLTTASQYTTKGAALVNESQDDARRKLRCQRAKTSSEKRIGKNLNRFKKQVMLRKMHCEESVWRTNLNFALAQAHIVLFYKALDQLHQGPLLDRYSQLDHLHFSMAYSGVSMRFRKNLQQHLPSQHNIIERNKTREREMEVQECDESHSYTEVTDENRSSLHIEQTIEMQRQTAASMLDSLTKAVLHLHRAMVLAHRSGHWAMLRNVGHTMWDQYCRTASIVQSGVHLELSSFITSEQQRNIFGPLLVLATKLIMDMLSQLGLWHVYEKDLSEEETQSCLYFSVPLDETTKIDMRWVKTLVIHTLEQLHDSGKWENLAHLALHFNAYTRDYYALLVLPLLINAQRKLLERIQSVKGPPAPQPHHVKTKEVTGHEVTYKSYVGTQLLSGWTHTQKVPILKKEARSRDRLKDAEVQRSMALVCVPLNVEDTLYWYRKAVEKRSSCLELFQHSRLHLQRLLVNTQPYYRVQREPSRSASMVEFNPMVITALSVKPCDLMEEDYRTIDSLYSLPLSPEHIPTITAAFTTAINYFHENQCQSLTVVALHELGNLQYYNGNTKAAHSCWTKAINSALKSPDALEKWDGVTFGECSLQQRLKVSGVWGCLQAACLTAKIAQYILTTDISKRTNFCLQSAHLFKCVLCCSLAQPQADLHYASGLVIHELLPGVDLFSDPSRVHLSTIVTSLTFICQWLFSTSHYIKLLPMLALKLYCVGSVCRDVQRSIECKILKVRTLTELGLFTEAVREAVLLTKGAGIYLPHGHFIRTDRDQLGNEFSSSKSVIDNIEMLEELVNSDLTPGVCTQYGSTYLRYNLARIQLILAISATISSSLLVPENEIISTDSEQEEAKHLDLESLREQLTVGQLKYLLLEAASRLLNSITKQLAAYSHVDRDELIVESNLLKSKLYLLKGQAALSAEMATQSLRLLQSASEHIQSPIYLFEQKASHKQPGSEGGSNQHCLDCDSVEMAQSSERVGCSLWIRCRVTLVHCLTAHDPNNGSSGQEDNQLKRETTQMIRDGIEECKRWGDHDSQALLMLEGAKWDRSTADKSSQVKEIVSLLSGRLNMSPHSAITLAQATMLLNDMKTPESITFLKLSHKLLQNQLCSFSPHVLGDGESDLPCFSNTCLPYFHLLRHTTSCIGQMIEKPEGLNSRDVEK